MINASDLQGIAPERIQWLNERAICSGSFVLYWMQQAQRAEQNPALEVAIQIANILKQPLVVGFALTANYPEANRRHYAFMLEGLQETQARLHEKRIKMVLKLGEPVDVISRLGRRASIIVCDRGYMRHQKRWRRSLAESLESPLLQVEGEVVVPVETASNKAEFAARTIRPKLERQLDRFLGKMPTSEVEESSLGLRIAGRSLSQVSRLLDLLQLDHDVAPVPDFFRGGASWAERRLERFLAEEGADYPKRRADPAQHSHLRLSPYLHFGQISPIYLAWRLRGSRDLSQEGKSTLLEELIIRRELAHNFVHFAHDRYDRWAGLPEWARKTLKEHRADPRNPCYDLEALEAAATHDRYWNAAMQEMKLTGYMHNTMRMYWGKKILEWSPSPEAGFERTLHLNNKYFLDGRDPNSFANVGWIFGLHDRPWKERAIFGKVRYMAASGLDRKGNLEKYISETTGR